eukprot:352605-Chlamydomonas_euryale.AAC.1
MHARHTHTHTHTRKECKVKLVLAVCLRSGAVATAAAGRRLRNDLKAFPAAGRRAANPLAHRSTAVFIVIIIGFDAPTPRRVVVTVVRLGAAGGPRGGGRRLARALRAACHAHAVIVAAVPLDVCVRKKVLHTRAEVHVDEGRGTEIHGGTRRY